MSGPATLTPEQEKRVRSLVGETLVEIIYHAALNAACLVNESVDFINQGEPFTPQQARPEAYD